MRTTIRLDEDLKRRALEYAKSHDMTFRQVVERGLETLLIHEKRQRRGPRRPLPTASLGLPQVPIGLLNRTSELELMMDLEERSYGPAQEKAEPAAARPARRKRAAS
jgi:hypothetical protein